MFRVGQRVVCINDNWSHERMVHAIATPQRPVKGQVYTVRGLHYVVEGRQTILLEEVVNPPFQWKEPWGRLEPGFYINRFRPLVEKKTDISSLVALLNPANHKQLEDVK